MPKKIAIVVTNQSEYPGHNRPTGLWLSELVHFWDVLEPEGFEFDLVSPKGGETPVPPQNPVDHTIVDVSALGVNLTYPDASLAVRSAGDRPIEPEAAARTRSADPRLATTAGHCAPNDISLRDTSPS